jgi:AcrR family transcriptional regulator
MHKKNGNVEARIFDAARTVFLRQGLEGTSMGQIATEAGLSRPALHYYFRGKHQLFAAVFGQALDNFIAQLNDIIEMDAPLEKKLAIFVRDELAMLCANPFLPNFILHELRRQPEAIVALLRARTAVLNTARLDRELKAARATGHLRPFTYADLMTNVSGLCLYPFIAKPLMMEYFFKNDDRAFARFIEKRKKEIVEILSEWLFVRPNHTARRKRL